MILFLNETNVSGGSEKILCNIIDSFVSQGHEIRGICNKTNPVRMNKNIKCHYIHTPFDFSPRSQETILRISWFSFLKFISYFSCFFSTCFLLFRNRPTSVYIHSGGFPAGFLNTAAISASLIFNIFHFRALKLSLSIHSIPSRSNIFLYPNFILLLLCSFCSQGLNIIFVSHYSRSAFESLFLFSFLSGHCFVIHNSIDLGYLHPVYNSFTNVPNHLLGNYLLRSKSRDSLDLAIVGYIDPIKDQFSAVQFFLQNISLIYSMKIKVNLHLYGSVKCEYSYNSFLSLLPEVDSCPFFEVVMHGEMPTNSIPYHSFHYLLSFSNIESYPLSILESICFGTPCLCNSVGGIPEIIRTNINGYLFDKDKLKKGLDSQIFHYLFLPISDYNLYQRLCLDTYWSSQKHISANSSAQSLYSSLLCNHQ